MRATSSACRGQTASCITSAAGSEIPWATPPRSGIEQSFEHVHPDDREALRAKYQQLVDGEIKTYLARVSGPAQGRLVPLAGVELHSALDNPLIDGVVVNSRDITERKLAECRLAQREEVFRLAADAVDGIIYEWDVASGFVHRSRGVHRGAGHRARRSGAHRSRLVGADPSAGFRGGSKERSHLGLLNGRGWTATYRIRDARGRYRSILERGLIQRNAGGDPVRAIGCCVDVSEIKRVTDLLAETQRTAKMGGWEYSYVTRELTWTDEMYRIYEAESRGIRRVLGFDAGAMHAGIAAALPRGLRSSRSGGRTDSTSNSKSRPSRISASGCGSSGIWSCWTAARSAPSARCRTSRRRSSRRSRWRTVPAGSSCR